MAINRHVWVLAHRYVGLLLAAFLILEGLTGSLLVYNGELEKLISPQLYARPVPGTERLSLGALATRAEALVPQARVGYFSLDASDQVVIRCVPRTNPATGKPYEIGFDHLFLNPWTGAELGRRRNGDLSQGLINLMPFIYQLHQSLALGSTGMLILGVVALVWTLDCFVALYLTFPRGFTAFWRRWKPAWKIKRHASATRLTFDLHRAGGLWFWLALLVFAWSSVMFNLIPVYEWVAGAVFDYESPMDLFKSLPKHESEAPRLDWPQAEAIGAKLMSEQAVLHGFEITRPYGLSYIPSLGLYSYSVLSSLDVRSAGWDTSVMFDGDTGELRHLDLPSGQHRGNTVSTWLWGLHFGDLSVVIAPPYRIFICIVGLMTAMLPVTGVVIWLKKRRATRVRQRRLVNEKSTTTDLAHVATRR